METGERDQEGGTAGERQGAAEEESPSRGNRFWREKWRGEKGRGEIDTWERDGGWERDKERRRRKTDTREETEMGERWRVT